MGYHSDLYGVQTDQNAFANEKELPVRVLARWLTETLDVDLESWHSESAGGIVYENAFDAEGEEHDVEVYLHPNHVVESTEDYWVEEQYREFALLLELSCRENGRLEATRQSIRNAKDLHLTLIRSSYSPGVGQPDIVTYSLKPESAEE